MRYPMLPMLGLLVMIGACKSAPTTGSSGLNDPNHITETELANLEESTVLTARQAVRRLRPNWLRPRSSSLGERHTAAVFRDGVQMGGLEALDDMDVRNIMEFRYLSASDATNRYGTGYPGGIILVFSKRSP